MATIITRNKHLYIVYYDRIKKSTRQKALGLISSKENLKLARLAAKEFQQEIDDKYKKIYSSGLKIITLDIAFDHFKKLNADKHQTTKSEYNRFYNLFIEQYPKDIPCLNINKLDTEKWLLDVKALNKRQNTKRNYYKVLKKFLSFLFEYNYCVPFKLNKEVSIPSEIIPIEIFRTEDIIKIFENLDSKSLNFQTMIFLLFYTGLRPSDIINICKDDIDFENETLRYYSVKTDDHFIIPIHKDLLSFLRNTIKNIESDRLLDYANTKNMGKAFRRYLDDIKIEYKKYTLRTFRKSFISNAYKSGIDLAMVSKLVGHRQITTTARYYNKIQISQQHKAINQMVIQTTERHNDTTYEEKILQQNLQQKKAKNNPI